ncbi:MAG: helix-turn-helix domain-containing protein, partial [Aeromonas veronii]
MTDNTNAMRCNILEAAYQLAQVDGWTNFKRDDVAEKAGVATGSVSHHFKTMDGLRD